MGNPSENQSNRTLIAILSAIIVALTLLLIVTAWWAWDVRRWYATMLAGEQEVHRQKHELWAEAMREERARCDRRMMHREPGAGEDAGMP